MIDYSAFAIPKKKNRLRGVKVYRDGRVKLSPAKWAKLRKTLWAERQHICGICHKEVELEDYSLDHIIPRGLGGATRDDRPQNLQIAHIHCNNDKGSKRL